MTLSTTALSLRKIIIMTLSIMAFGIMILNEKTNIIKTLGLMTFGIIILHRMTLSITAKLHRSNKHIMLFSVRIFILNDVILRDVTPCVSIMIKHTFKFCSHFNFN